MAETSQGTEDFDRLDGERMAGKKFAELDGFYLSLIARGTPEKLRTYADVATEANNAQVLAALGMAAFMQFRIPQNEGYTIPQELFIGYQEAFDYIQAASSSLRPDTQS